MNRILIFLVSVLLVSVSPIAHAQSLASEQFPECVSAASDPDGDGWGFENNVSCRVVPMTQTQPIPICSSISSDSDGDGWGFENDVSCLVNGSLAQSQLVLDVPPICSSEALAVDAQGWGWENDATCIESGSFAQSIFPVSIVVGTDNEATDDERVASIPFRTESRSTAPETTVTFDNELLNVNIVHEDPSGSARARYTIRPLIQDVDMLKTTAAFLDRPQQGFLRYEIGADLFNVTSDGGPEPGSRTDNVEVEIELALGATPDQDNWGYCLKVRRMDGVSDPLLGEDNECPGFFEEPLTVNTDHTLSVGIDRLTQEISITMNAQTFTHQSPLPIFQASAADNHFAQFRVRDGASVGSFAMKSVEINGAALDLSTAASADDQSPIVGTGSLEELTRLDYTNLLIGNTADFTEGSKIYYRDDGVKFSRRLSGDEFQGMWWLDDNGLLCEDIRGGLSTYCVADSENFMFTRSPGSLNIYNFSEVGFVSELIITEGDTLGLSGSQ